MTARRTPRQRKALRSAAAKKGWETRRLRQSFEVLADLPDKALALDPSGWLDHHAAVLDMAYGSPPPDPNPWPRWRAKVRSIMQRVVAWARR